MRRLAKIAVGAIAVYVALSLAFGILMARLTLSPMRLPLPARAQIALMYKPYGADLQSVSIQAADGVILRGWYVVPDHQNGQAVILLHGIGDNRGGVAGYGQAFLRQGYRGDIFDRPSTADPRRGGYQYSALALPHVGSG